MFSLYDWAQFLSFLPVTNTRVSSCYKKRKKKKALFPPLALSFLHGKDRKLNSVVHRGCLSLCDPCWQHVVLRWKLVLNPGLFRHIAFFFSTLTILLASSVYCHARVSVDQMWPSNIVWMLSSVCRRLMAAAAEQADLGESSNSSRSGVAVTLPDSLSSMFSAGPGHQVWRSRSRSILGGAHPHPHPHSPTLSLNTPKLAMWGTCRPFAALPACSSAAEHSNLHNSTPLLQYLLWGCMLLCMGG